MKIALSFSGCHGYGGVERLLLETANHLASRRHEVHVYATDFDTAALSAAAVKHYVRSAAGPALLKLASYTKHSALELARLRPEADVHGAFGVISPLGGVVNVQSVHAAWIKASQRLRNLTGRLRQRCNPIHPFILAREQKYFAQRNYRKLIAPTEQVKSDLMHFYAVPGDDVLIVPNGFSSESFSFERSQALREDTRNKFGYRKDDIVVLFVANELERKGFRQLIHAIAALNKPNLHFLAVVGRTSTDAYGSEIRHLGISRKVQITGAKRDLAPYYAAADIFALPTQYEAWGLVIVEALASGTPVLTSRLAGASVAIKEGKTGELLDDPTNESEIAAKLEHLYKTTPYLNRQAIGSSVLQYTWDNVLCAYEQILKDCATSPALY